MLAEESLAARFRRANFWDSVTAPASKVGRTNYRNARSEQNARLVCDHLKGNFRLGEQIARRERNCQQFTSVCIRHGYESETVIIYDGYQMLAQDVARRSATLR